MRFDPSLFLRGARNKQLLSWIQMCAMDITHVTCLTFGLCVGGLGDGRGRKGSERVTWGGLTGYGGEASPDDCNIHMLQDHLEQRSILSVIKRSTEHLCH